MKVYIFYLTLPDKLDKLDLPEKMINEFKEVSTLYTVNSLFNTETEMYYYLYAFTNDKKLADEFEYLHDSSMFTKIVKKMTSHEYEIFRKENLNSELRKYDYKNQKNGKDEYLVITRSESCDIPETLEISLYTVMMDYIDCEYECFKDKYIKALDALLYCTFNRINTDDSEVYSYNLSFGCTAEGYHNGVHYTCDILNMYLRMYALLLRKD